MANVHRTFKSAVKQCRREGQHQVAEEYTRRSKILTGRDQVAENTGELRNSLDLLRLPEPGEPLR